MTSLTGIAGRLLLVSLTVVLIVPVAAIAFAELGDDPSDGESVANATPSPAATATTGALEPEDMLGPDITDGGAGGRPAPSRGTIHELPKTPPAQLPDASSALPRTEALDELRTVIGLAEAVDAIRASDSGGVLVQMQTETWTCAERSHWGYPSVDACMQAPSTTADGQFDVVYWEGLRFAAGQMDQLLQLLFASKPTPVLGFKVTGTSEYRLYFQLVERVDASGLLENRNQGEIQIFYLQLNAQSPQPIESAGAVASFATLPEVMHFYAKRGDQLELILPSTLPEIPGWDEFDWELGRQR